MKEGKQHFFSFIKWSNVFIFSNSSYTIYEYNVSPKVSKLRLLEIMRVCIVLVFHSEATKPNNIFLINNSKVQNMIILFHAIC